jgi:hypothetical protein
MLAKLHTRRVWLVLSLLCVVSVAAAQEERRRRGRDREEGAENAEPRLAITIEGNLDEKLIPVAGQLSAHFFECYPKLLERFENPDKRAPREVRVVFEPRLRVPAYASGDQVTVSAEWLRNNPGDIGMLTHELTHVVQAYPKGDPGWFTEGLADYTRLLYGPKEQPDWSLPEKLTDKQSYKDSYRTTARFFQWVDEKHPGVLDKLHRNMQRDEFKVEQFTELTGKSVDDLWTECVAELSAKE